MPDYPLVIIFLFHCFPIMTIKEYIEYRNVDPTSSRRTHRALDRLLSYCKIIGSFDECDNICKCILEDNSNRPKEERLNENHLLKIIKLFDGTTGGIGVYDSISYIVKNCDLTKRIVMKIIDKCSDEQLYHFVENCNLPETMIIKMIDNFRDIGIFYYILENYDLSEKNIIKMIDSFVTNCLYDASSGGFLVDFYEIIKKKYPNYNVEKVVLEFIISYVR